MIQVLKFLLLPIYLLVVVLKFFLALLLFIFYLLQVVLTHK